MNIGDTVRFLNDVGGGKVSAFRPGGIVLVQDEDGFDMPVHESEVVVVETNANNVEKKEKPKPKVEYGTIPTEKDGVSLERVKDSLSANRAKDTIPAKDTSAAKDSSSERVKGSEYLKQKTHPTAAEDVPDEVDEILEARVARLEMTVNRLQMQLNFLMNERAEKKRQPSTKAEKDKPRTSLTIL